MPDNLLVTPDDVNVHLPSDKLFVEQADLPLLSKEAERIIRGTLAGVIPPVTLATWITPATTPELIRSIVGRFIAGFVYARAYSEDSVDVPTYAQNKYNEAMRWLNEIAAGTRIIEAIDGVSIIVQTHSLTANDFLPNDASSLLSPAKFRMDMDFGSAR